MFERQEPTKTVGKIYMNGPKGENLDAAIAKVLNYMKDKKIKFTIQMYTETPQVYERFVAFPNGYKTKDTDPHFVIKEAFALTTKPVAKTQDIEDDFPL